MFKELGSNVFVGRVLVCQFQGDRKHGQTIERHPGSPVSLLKLSSCRHWPGAVKHTDVIQTEEATGEQMLPVNVLTVHPPREIDEQLLKHTCEELPITTTAWSGHLIDTPAGPGMNRRVHVRKSEFVCRNLPVGMHVPFTKHQDQLRLGKFRVNLCHRNHMKGKVPCRVPWIFPFVGHRDDVSIEQVHPISISAHFSAGGRRR